MKEKLQNALLVVRRYWQRPPKGQEVAYKEIAAFSVGSMGIKGYSNLMTKYIQMTATCLLTGTVYGLSPRDLMYLFIITNVLGVIKTPFISMLVDNTNTPIGKFRPYILWAGIPTVIAIVGLTWLIPCEQTVIPFDTAAMLENGMSPEALRITKIVLIGVFYNLLSISQPLTGNAQVGLTQVISSNSAERSKILGFSEVLGNLGPSIIQFLLPTVGGLIFGADAMKNIWTYRILMPVFALASFIMSFFALYYTQERAVLPKMHVNKIKFIEGMKILGKNREFWAITVTRFFDSFKTSLVALLPWVCTYQLQNSSFQGIAETIVSIGFTPGMILAPILIAKLGTRKSGLTFCMANCVATAIMFFSFKSGFVFFVMSLFIFNFADGPQYIIQSTVMCDCLDAQQDKTGVRIEGFAQNFQGMVTTIGTILSTILFTFVYEHFGLVSDPNTGLTDYDILYKAEVREPIISTVILIAICASLLAALPYLFVKLDRKTMTAIRASLERKKVIADLALADAPMQEQDAAYEAFLADKAAKEEEAAAKAAEEKAQLKAKQEKKKADEAAYKAMLDEIAAKVIAEGGSDADARRAVKAEKKARRDKKRAATKAMFDKLRADSKALNERKKQFCKEWIAAAKAEGKKKWLHVLAREAFSRQLAKEANEQPSDDTPAEAPTDTPTKSVAG